MYRYPPAPKAITSAMADYGRGLAPAGDDFEQGQEDLVRGNLAAGEPALDLRERAADRVGERFEAARRFERLARGARVNRFFRHDRRKSIQRARRAAVTESSNFCSGAAASTRISSRAARKRPASFRCPPSSVHAGESAGATASCHATVTSAPSGPVDSRRARSNTGSRPALASRRSALYCSRRTFST